MTANPVGERSLIVRLIGGAEPVDGSLQSLVIPSLHE